jgi:DNA-binding Lrp family transcriptional regulator
MSRSKLKSPQSTYKIDDLDKKIVSLLHEDARIPVQLISEKVGTPASTVHYRLKKMNEGELIEGYYVKINPTKVDLDYMTIIQVRTKESTKNFRKTGAILASIDGIWGVYFMLGDWDFILHCRTKNRMTYLNILEQIMEIEDVERTSSLIIAEVIKEDPRIELT